MMNYARQFRLNGRDTFVTGGACVVLHLATDAARLSTGPGPVLYGGYTLA